MLARSSNGFGGLLKRSLFGALTLFPDEAKRRTLLAAVKAAGGTDVLEADVANSTESRIELDPLREGWKQFVQELKASPGLLDGHRKVLSVREQFIGRSWSKEFTEDELNIMFGTSEDWVFGRLSEMKQSQSHFRVANIPTSEKRLAQSWTMRPG